MLSQTARKGYSVVLPAEYEMPAAKAMTKRKNIGKTMAEGNGAVK
jgi:hypothetical protein